MLLQYKNPKTTEEYVAYKMIRNRENEGIRNLKKTYWMFSVEI